MIAALFRRRLKPRPLPSPQDTFLKTFLTGYALGVVHCVAAAVVALAGGR